MIGRAAGNSITLEIANEPLLPGPQGSRVQVIDYDGSTRALYEPVDLDDPAVLMNDGLTPTESDPRFHQQMVYAVAMKVLENFESALGRPLMFHRNKRLKIYPHAFKGANAFYDPDLTALLFGYFTADEEDPGPNLPGQTVFACLSHDIIAHEMTHALVHRLRPHFIDAANPDVFAFHEGFSDIVAIFQHFSFQNVLAETIQKTRGDLRSPTTLVELAQQFGYATGSGAALRTALDTGGKPDPQLYRTALEPHDRGSILVAAVFDAFFSAYQHRIKDLIRIATGGTGRLPEGDLHPDLVNRIAKEASKSAQNVLTMCMRAFEYLPPVDVDYGDFLRAIVTADYEMVPEDGVGLRSALIEAFRVRGVYPTGVISLAEDSLLWPDRESEGLVLPFAPFKEALVNNAKAFDRWGRRVPDTPDTRGAMDKWAVLLGKFAAEHAAVLGLDPAAERKPKLDGFHTVFRFSPKGQLVVELVAQFTQEDLRARDDPAFGGVPVRGGTTIIANAEGKVRYIISKPLEDERRTRQRDFVEASDRSDAILAWCDDGYEPKRMRLRTSFAALHRRLL